MKLLFQICFVFLSTAVFAQSNNNLQSYIGAYVLPIDQVEIKVFNNLYSQKAFFNDKGSKTDDIRRSSFNTNFIQTTVGISNRVNIGLDLQIRSVFYDDQFGSALEVLKFGTSNNERTALAYIGPRIRWLPFKNHSNITVQSTFFIPTAPQLEGNGETRPFLDHDGYQWWNEIFYSKDWSSKFNFFGSFATIWKIDTPESAGLANFTTSIKAFVNFFPNDKWTLYSTMELAPTFGDSFVSAYYLQEGLGIKRNLGSSSELEVLYTNFIAGKNGGAGETYNLGLRKVF